MAKTLHNRHNKIFLTMLRGLRESQNLRQSDLAGLLGRSQATVSNIERGERMLDLIELRDWLDALEVDFIGFLSVLDAELRRRGTTRTDASSRQRLRRRETTTTLNRMLMSVGDVGK
jgi:transcriptional regulator with XRE-family HTH domain